MTINRVLTVAAIFVAATALVYLSRPHGQLPKPRVFVAGIPNQPESQLAQATKYLRETCPDIIVIGDHERADYWLNAVWLGGNWVVSVKRSDFPQVFIKTDSPDATETFRQSCTAIRDDAKEMADFEAHTAAMPSGRYVLNSVNPDGFFLLDTKTGAVWELKPYKDNPEFERISVEGLYSRKVFGQ